MKFNFLVCCLLVAVSMGSNAATVFDASDIGSSVDLKFNGVVKGKVVTGLSATANIELTSVSDNQTMWAFTVTLTNSSESPITASRISMLGFNTDPNVDVKHSSTTGLFNKIGKGNVPQAGVAEICANNQNRNCAGGGGTGLLIGDTDDFIITLAFANSIDQLTLDNYLVRYQSIKGAGCATSGTGFGSEVPVPAAVWLFASALLGLVGVKRQQA